MFVCFIKETLALRYILKYFQMKMYVLDLLQNNPRGWEWGVGRSKHVIKIGPELKTVDG